MNMLLGEKLKKARKNIGMSQNEVAEELMLSRQTIAHGFLPKGFSWIRVPVPQEARVTPSVRAASVRWMPVSGPSTSEAWTGIDEKIQRPQSKELANNFLNFIKCPPFTF